MPIEAVNLKSVQVAAFQIYPGNMAQFFQVNSLEGSEELARVGRYLWRKTVALSEDPAVTGRWSALRPRRHAALQGEPGQPVPHRPVLQPRQFDLSLRRGGRPVVVEPPLKNMDDVGYGRYSNWDYDDEGYEYGSGEWATANNPCSDAYYLPRYNREAVVGRNFLRLRHRPRRQARGRRHAPRRDDRHRDGPAALRPAVRAYNYQNQLLGETTSRRQRLRRLRPQGPCLLRLGGGRRGHRLSAHRRRRRPAPEPLRRRRRGHREGRQGHPLRRARRLAARRHAPPDLRPVRPGEGPAGRTPRAPGDRQPAGTARPDGSSRTRSSSRSTPSGSRRTRRRPRATGRPASSSAA